MGKDLSCGPKVSLVVPVHNEEKVLGAALDSLTEQTYSNREIIVALNGCSDRSRQIAESVEGLIVTESEQAGISLGRNQGALAATGSILVFMDADTTVPPDTLACAVRYAERADEVVFGLPGRPDRGGGVVRICFWLANRYARTGHASPPGGVTVIHQTLFERIGGFDEDLPQGTNTDLIWRAIAAGGTWLYPHDMVGITSIRRFEKTGIVHQMLEWRRNHKLMKKGRHEELLQRPYEVIR